MAQRRQHRQSSRWTARLSRALISTALLSAVSCGGELASPTSPRDPEGRVGGGASGAERPDAPRPDWPGSGRSHNLGAYYDDDGGLHIAVRSERAERMEAWLYAAPIDAPQRARVLLRREGDTFRGQLSAEQLDAFGLSGTVYYGLRAWGPNWPWHPTWTPGSEAGFVSDVDERGNRFNPNKLLSDPYARELSHDPHNSEKRGWSSYLSGAEQRAVDTGQRAPKGIVLANDETDIGVAPPGTLADQIIYEVHLRGFTKGDTSLPSELRGTYAGAARRARYLADSGVTAIELLPLHETQNEQNDEVPDTSQGDNYWGYASLSFMAPERRYAADRSPGGPTRELKAMVRAFHEVGISVYVDIVFNHTAEGGHWDKDGAVAPVLSWRGIDNDGYYQLAAKPQHYQNDNGVGPNLDATSELSRELVVDSLRYWHEELGVDGFRFDLASVLGNSCVAGCFQFGPDDPAGILARLRRELPSAVLIAEPWGTGPGTYQVGNFPAGWAEWNGPYRDVIREAQNRQGLTDITPGHLANRLSGSWELFGDDGRKPWHSINFLTAHDGLTLRDLFSCNDKHNLQAWPYGPSDGGASDNIAWDQGGDAQAQEHAARTGLGLLMVSAGVPMITGGDEMFRTQRCNNNAYNLDSPGIWLDYRDLDRNAEFNHFARHMMRFRARHPVLRPANFRQGSDGNDNGLPLIRWFQPSGQEADADYLDNPANHFIAFQLDGTEVADPARSIFIAYNGWHKSLPITLPPTAAGHRWYLASDSAPWMKSQGNFMAPGHEKGLGGLSYQLHERSLLILIEQP